MQWELAVAALLVLTNAPRVRPLLLDDAETAIRASVAKVEADYNAIFNQGETYGVCEYFDACNDPLVSSANGQTVSGWLTSGTPFHGFCDALNGSTSSTYPESPDCPAVEHTVCGLNVTYDTASTRLVSDSNVASDVLNDAICVLSRLDGEWETSFAGILDAENYTEVLYATVGDTGLLNQYPGLEWGECPSDYDARFRPWYAAAAVGPKNVIVVIDTSGSMNQHARMDLAKAAAKKVLGTLTEYDYAGLVEFSSTASTYRSTMMNYSANEACLMADYIDNLRVGGATNYEDAFNKAFEMYDASVAAGKIAACDTTALLFLTDGEVTAGELDGTTLLNGISALHASHPNVRTFTYALGDEVEDTSMTEQIACVGNGVAFTIADGGDLADAMASYYYLFSAAINPSTVEPVWVKYREYNSGEFHGSVCMSAYDDGLGDSTVRNLFGVVCADLALPHIEAVDGNLNHLNVLLAASETSCPTFTTLNAAQLETVRQSMSGTVGRCSTISTTTTTSAAAAAAAAVPWYYWGAPVIAVVLIAVIVVGVVVGTKKGTQKSGAPAAAPHAHAPVPVGGGGGGVDADGAGAAGLPVEEDVPMAAVFLGAPDAATQDAQMVGDNALAQHKAQKEQEHVRADERRRQEEQQRWRQEQHQEEQARLQYEAQMRAEEEARRQQQQQQQQHRHRQQPPPPNHYPPPPPHHQAHDQHSGVPAQQQPYDQYSGIPAQQQSYDQYSGAPAQQQPYEQYGGSRR